jgi:hypothetical protein
MKKILLTAVLLGCCLMSICAQTELERTEKTTFGLKAEANLSNFIFNFKQHSMYF